MWSNNATAKKRLARMAKHNRSMAAAITICAALAVTAGCGGASGGAHHGNHAVEATGSGGGGSQTEHDGHSAGAHNGEHGEQAAGTAHEGHGSTDEASSSLTWSFEPKHPEAGETVSIAMDMKDGQGNPLESFDVSHEKLMHLIVVSEDLSEFQHLHPEYDGKSGFRLTTELSNGGTYRLFADYKPSGASAATAMGSVHVAGTEKKVPLAPDTDISEPKRIDGVNVSLAVSSMKAGEEAELTFRFEDAKSGKAVADLEPYLGAIGHVVVIGEGAEQYLHVHAENDNGSGPEAKFATRFPEPGLYRIWGQFQRNGEPFTVSYTVKAE